jgi:hypothetical protein
MKKSRFGKESKFVAWLILKIGLATVGECQPSKKRFVDQT